MASKHYWQVTEEDYARATAEAAQNPAQQAHVSCRKDSQTERTAHEKTPVWPGFATGCDLVHNRTVGDTGFEPVTSAM